MLPLSTDQRRQLWHSRNWPRTIEHWADDLLGEAPSSELASSALSLGQLAEAVHPNRRIAIALYRWSWHCEPVIQNIRRGRSLALELGDFETCADLAALEYGHSGDAALLVVEALARLDAGTPEASLSPLAKAREQFPSNSSLAALFEGASGELADLPGVIRNLENTAAGESKIVSAGLLLQAARLSKLLPGNEDAEQLLMRAFDAYPADESVFSLLENRWIAEQQWRRLTNLYRIRFETAQKRGREVESYRRAGTRLVCFSASPALGVRLLQQAIGAIYKGNMEVPELIAMLSLVVDQLVETEATPSAIRLLAQGLAHPRTDDEAFWIVNTGIALACGDVAMQRTTATFAALRERLLIDLPECALPEPGRAAAEPTMREERAEFESEGRLDTGELEAIDFEIEEFTRPNGLPATVADRVDIAADINIAVRAHFSPGNSPHAKKVEAITRDISTSGLFLACTTPLALGEELSFTILLPGEDDWSLVEHQVKGIVARVQGGIGYGIQYTEVPDAYLNDIRALAASAA